jgi:GTPase SAR1 family protein
VESNWNTFDCVVAVMDAIQGVNTEEQVGLLKFVKRSNQKYKDVPIIVLGNKMDDLNDEDTIHLMEETRSKTIEIFGNVDCKSMPHTIEATDEEVNANEKKCIHIYEGGKH